MELRGQHLWTKNQKDDIILHKSLGVKPPEELLNSPILQKKNPLKENNDLYECKQWFYEYIKKIIDGEIKTAVAAGFAMLFLPMLIVTFLTFFLTSLSWILVTISSLVICIILAFIISIPCRKRLYKLLETTDTYLIAIINIHDKNELYDELQDKRVIKDIVSPDRLTSLKKEFMMGEFNNIDTYTLTVQSNSEVDVVYKIIISNSFYCFLST